MIHASYDRIVNDSCEIFNCVTFEYLYDTGRDECNLSTQLAFLLDYNKYNTNIILINGKYQALVVVCYVCKKYLK